MSILRIWRAILASDIGLLLLLALAKFILHMLTNGQYGFHRDELGSLEDARVLAWGYVSSPPLAPFIARTAETLFGPSLVGLRTFAALGQSAAMVLAGLIARELGGGRRAQVMAALATAIATVSLVWSSFFHYGGFDYLWWVLLAYFAACLLRTENPRLWLGIGATIGLGMLTKYTIAFCVAGLAVGVVLTSARRYLPNRWLWAGAGLAILIFLPNLIWQAQNNFIHFEFLGAIHARDISIGRAQSFLTDQLYLPVNPVTIPLWVAGLYFFFIAPAGKRYRLLGWMAVVSFALFVVAQSRGYYTGPLFPLLLAGGAVWGESWLASLPAKRARGWMMITWSTLAIGGLLVAALILPIAPINSAWWNVARGLYYEPNEQIGWPELVNSVAVIYNRLPSADKPTAGILANYSEAGAINLFGPALGLPTAMGSQNTDWLRGYGDPPPQTLIIVGWTRGQVDRYFNSCTLEGRLTNPYGIKNEDATVHPELYVCRGTREPWPQLWQHIHIFG